ncbi:hypothetical protein N7510_009210 [Penicillium lagena]|uniref:uncharacterized protein n=1 Tax=Penicillium lagena TaxID=94218 RepID=UPI002540B80D|nr:uncharacterized protein N7510_009210 [Penicillium lagena]KAJ5606429.1 hypothetical protein N7510_009210 [Penicillium lagena]
MSTVPPPDLIKGSLASGEGILMLGLPRSGSLSLTWALRRLGYKHVHHATEQIQDSAQWETAIRAAWACFPVLSRNAGTPMPAPFTRSDWDSFLGQWQAVSDTASVFAPQLIESYPNAKVILVQRPFNAWYKSFSDVFFDTLFSPIRGFLLQRIIAPITGLSVFVSQPIVVYGFFGTRSAREAKLNAKETYDKHYATVRKMVKPENLLEYKLGDGWEPLCKFLSKDVPDEQFPRVNESSNIKDFINKQIASLLLLSLSIVIKKLSYALFFGLGYYVRGKEFY